MLHLYLNMFQSSRLDEYIAYIECNHTPVLHMHKYGLHYVKEEKTLIW